jgi:hypothetical protein
LADRDGTKKEQQRYLGGRAVHGAILIPGGFFIHTMRVGEKRLAPRFDSVKFKFWFWLDGRQSGSQAGFGESGTTADPSLHSAIDVRA